MGMQDIITTKLLAAFAPESVHVEDESNLHQGHAGHRPGGESHYRVYIVSEAFRGKSRLERHRMINTALANELKDRVHALAIHAQAPGES
jgi:BolA protein